MPRHREDQDLDSFRRRARQWLGEHAPRSGWTGPGGSATYETWAEARRFQAMQYEAGFSGIAWPERYGGQGLSQAHQAAFNQEAETYSLPSSAFQITLSNIAPVLLEHGTEKQRERYLPEMLRGQALWVQLLSEPGAGSDLGAARTHAERDGEEWALNGQKVWSSFAQWSDYAMVLARTDWDAPKYAGLTMFIMPLAAPGVTIVPLKQISGNDEFCEEFLDDVRLGDDSLLGEVNGGWSVVHALIRHSRQMTAGAGSSGPIFDPARGGEADPGRDLIDFVNQAGLGREGEVRALVAELVADNVVSGLLARRITELTRQPNANPAVATLGKLFSAVTLQRRYEIELQVREEATVAWLPNDEQGSKPFRNYLWGRTATIAGGTHEINNNTIGERILGLPAEPSTDRNRPFREVTG